MASLKVNLNGRNIFATPTGLKATARGKVIPASVFFGTMPKGEARRLRKALRKAGEARKASEPRRTDPEVARLMEGGDPPAP